MSNVKDWDAEDFLELVYGDRSAWVDLPAKINGYWSSWYTEWPAEGKVSRYIDAAARDGEDLYYSVAQFGQRGRRIEDVLPSHWLWADLDEVHPTAASKLLLHPTVAVESSPGRYQALWRLTGELRPATLAKLNRALSYALDADHGGHDLTQVLRIPGTRNFKYPEAPFVKLLWYEETAVYDPRKVWAKVKGLVPPEEFDRVVHLKIDRRDVPTRVRQLLETPDDRVVEGERSARLWELECALIECGWEDDEVFEAVWKCAWNKWKGVATGRKMLAREIKKARTRVSAAALRREDTNEKNHENNSNGRSRGSGVNGGLRQPLQKHELGRQNGASATHVDSDEGLRLLPLIGHSDFLWQHIRRPRWMVDQIWSAGAQGFIAGEPKSSKSAVALAMAIAVASGEPFLGKYAVKSPGPVIFIDDETGRYTTQDRMRRFEHKMGIFDPQDVVESEVGIFNIDLSGSEIPIHMVSEFGMNLMDEDHRNRFERTIEHVMPSLVVLDPFYMLTGDLDELRAAEVKPVLKWLKTIKQQAGCSIAVVHHFKKASENTKGARSGQKMMGSTYLHGWSESSLFCTAEDDPRSGWTRVKIETEHRQSASRKDLSLAWTMSEDVEDFIGMEWEVDVPQSVVVKDTKVAKVEGIVQEHGGSMGLRDLRETLGWAVKTVNSYIDKSSHLTVGNAGSAKVVTYAE